MGDRHLSPLLRRPEATSGTIQRITPVDAGWSYVGFEVLDLAASATIERATEANEICLVLLSGSAHVYVGTTDFGMIGGRTGPFEGPSTSLYVPPGHTWRFLTQGPCELAICASPARGRHSARLITAADAKDEIRGTGTNTRYVRNILPDTAQAETLLVVEVVTPGGHWSSYPPHKHDTDDYPRETYLEETYYHRLRRGSGFAFQRVYTDDGELDETIAVSDRDVVLVPRGYHPVGAPHGCDLYYLNVMAGPRREWKFSTAPDHAFLAW